MSKRDELINLVKAQLGRPYSSMGDMFHGSKGWGCAQLVAQCHNKILGTDFVGSCYDFAGDICYRSPNQGFKFSRTYNPIAGDVVLYYINNNTNDNYNCGHAALYMGNGRVIGAYGQKQIGEAGNWGDVRNTSVNSQGLGGAIVYARCKLLEANTQNDIAGEYTVNVDVLNVRDSPSLNGKIIAQYKRNNTIRLDDIRIVADGYIWGRYKGSTSGLARYVAIGKNTGKTENDDYLIKKK